MTKPTGNKPTIEENREANINIVYQDLADYNKKLANIQSQITRIQRVIKIDEKEEVTQKRRSEVMLLNAIESNTEVVNRLVTKLDGSEDDPLDMSYYKTRRKEEQKKLEDGLERIRFLSRCRQKTTEVCSCGEHHGIQFLDDEGNVIEERCPRSWWISMYRLAFSEGRGKEFTNHTPSDKYIGKYTRKIKQ